MHHFKSNLVINQCHIYTIKVELVYNFSISPISTIKLVWHSSLKLKGKALLYEGYKYLKIRDGKDHTFWRCERHRSQCPAKATTHERIISYW